MNFYYWIGYHLSRLVGRLFFHFRVIHRERMLQSGPGHSRDEPPELS